jgi:hypothetical protein
VATSRWLGREPSEVILAALSRAARRVQRKEALAREVASLGADEEDRREMLGLAAFTESLRARG